MSKVNGMLSRAPVDYDPPANGTDQLQWIVDSYQSLGSLSLQTKVLRAILDLLFQGKAGVKIIGDDEPSSHSEYFIRSSGPALDHIEIDDSPLPARMNCPACNR